MCYEQFNLREAYNDPATSELAIRRLLQLLARSIADQLRKDDARSKSSKDK